MPGSPVRLGPFTGGLNTLSDPTALDDTELVDCVNFELDLDGSLLSRPPIAVKQLGPASSLVKCLGYASIAGVNYLILTTGSSTYYYLTGSFTLITNTFAASSFVQYRDKVWLVNGTPGGGGNWTPGGGFTAVAAIPKGMNAFVKNQIMFIVPGTGNGSVIYYSAPDDFLTWTIASNFITVNQGDGQDVVDAVVFNGTIYAFKQDSTYVLNYDLIPNTADIRRVSATIGVSAANCLAQYEQAIYIYHEGNIYEITNFDFTRINSKVPFLYDATAPSTFIYPAFLSIFGDRLIVRYFNRIYVYGMRTRTWTRWESTRYFGPIVLSPSTVIAATNTVYYMGSCVSGDFNLYTIEDGFSLSNAETMVSKINTKNYDFAISHHFKRLFWWGVDSSAATAITGVVTPVVTNFSVTWDDLASRSWDSLGSWDQPLTAPLSITTNVNASIGVARKFIKFMKSLRFREINFGVNIPNTGVTTDSPVRIFNITALIATKETVVASVS